MKKFNDLVKLTEASNASTMTFEFQGAANQAEKTAQAIFEAISDEVFNDNVTIESSAVRYSIVLSAMNPSPVKEWRLLAAKLLKKFKLIKVPVIK
jgi:hypothetical protein